ncbi:MAG: glycoside hydrolase family 3 C-terminal domain-containing protein [Clostridia bacterium]|nr:glycoside hydrolase family 3 C-terminal domain-containing protein [Clostridia bacterium]
MNQQRIDQCRQKAESLVAQMDLIEKASLLRYNSPGVPRLGIPAYNWWNEGLHGLARTGTATVFPQAIGLAAMFDPKTLEEIGDAVATETRAKFNENQKQGVVGRYKGLTLWSPNINIFRDPRWGRGQETYGEDPYLTSQLGVAYIKGLQGKDEKYYKTAACAKHFAVHSGPEQGRHEFDSVVNDKDLYETYLPAFEAAVKEGEVASVMGAYNRLNGEVCCGHEWMIQELLRKQWGFDGYFVSDCGAIYDFHVNHKVTKTPQESAAKAVHAGCDINCGDVYVHVVQAVEEGLLSEEDVTRSAVQALTTRLLLGLMSEDCPYDDIPFEKVDCKEYRDLAVKATEQSCVLLKNNGILPLDQSKYKSIAVIGPNAANVNCLNGNYNGTSAEYINFVDGIRNACGDDVTVRYARGCHHYMEKDGDWFESELQSLTEAIMTAKHSDLVVLCVGLDPTFEGEEGDANNPFGAGDRNTLKLPHPQVELIEEVVKVGKPTVVVLCAGGAIDLTFEDKNCDAILHTFYPGGRGGEGVANLLFGKACPQANLPVTFYKSAEDLPHYHDYNMKGRTYRYFEGEPLYPFGYGLSYGKAEITKVEMADTVTDTLPVTVTVKNTGDWDFAPLVQVYVKGKTSELAPINPVLCGFARVQTKAGETATVTITLDSNAFTVINELGERVVDDQEFDLYVGLCGPDKRSQQLTGHKAICKTVVKA